MKRISALVGLLVLVLAANLLAQSAAVADTKYSAYGWGRTYRNNFTTSCIYWGIPPVNRRVHSAYGQTLSRSLRAMS